MQKIGEKVSTETLNKNILPSLLRDNGQHCDISQAKYGMGFQYDTGGSGTTGPFICGGTYGFLLQMVCGYGNGAGGYNNLKFRTHNGEQSKWNKWYTVYCDGNLFPATQTTTGLMSAADKKKLDGLGTNTLQIIGWGRITSAGDKVDCSEIIESVYKINVGIYQINISNPNNWNYIVQATIESGSSSNYHGTASVGYRVGTQFTVITSVGPNLSNMTFSFVIYKLP